MTYITSWEEFAKAAERLYLADPTKARFSMKYRHCDGKLTVKLTDNHVCLMYRTEHAQDVKKLERFTSHLMRHMSSKEGR
ncbi:signal recognition particle 9 kDa protein-like [Tubulanus polymorphus]|uniref:signal recognition particle 9 kDa protein-like n=1 Tax=Tubulanus polymorphus TaxID=672921 RepID=UPI003DA54E77